MGEEQEKLGSSQKYAIIVTSYCRRNGRNPFRGLSNDSPQFHSNRAFPGIRGDGKVGLSSDDASPRATSSWPVSLGDMTEKCGISRQLRNKYTFAVEWRRVEPRDR